LLSALNPITAPASLKEIAFQAIKNAIMNNQLEPGRVYNASDFAKQLAISNTPIREALMDLATRGFLTILPRKGVMINVLSAAEVENLYEFRSVIERAVIRRITPLLGSKEIAEIQENFARQRMAIQARNDRRYLEIDREFHLYLCSLTRNPYMISALGNIRDLVDWMGWKTFSRQERLQEIDAEHEGIINRLKAGDAEGAEMMMGRHIEISRQTILRHYRVETTEPSAEPKLIMISKLVEED